MGVLVLESNVPERTRLCQSLAQSGHTVATTASELGELLGLPLAIGPAAAATETATVVLSLSAQKVEIHLAVGVDARGGKNLCERLLGGPAGVDVLRDTLREIANTLGGAFKRAALVDGQVFSLGLPTSTGAMTADASARAWGLVGGSMAFTVTTVVRTSRPKACKAASLLEGMVLPQDIRSAQGVMMLSTGTALTERTVQRIVEILGESALVHVTQPESLALGVA